VAGLVAVAEEAVASADLEAVVLEVGVQVEVGSIIACHF
jgi:hypothetical protein